MSHIVKMRAQISDLEALGEAAANKGGQLNVGRKIARSFSPAKCEHTLSLLGNADAYEVAIYRDGVDADGNTVWDLGFDDWGMRGQALVNAFGPDLMGLRNEYAAIVTERQLKAEGWMVQRGYDEQQRLYVDAS